MVHERQTAHGRELAIIGLGYVGLPVAVAFARSGVPVVGFDIDRVRVEELRAGFDRIDRRRNGNDVEIRARQRLRVVGKDECWMREIRGFDLARARRAVPISPLSTAPRRQWANSSRWATLSLVGGHCIGVDPYYLTYRAEKSGYEPQVILAGRRINDSVGQRIAHECIRHLLKRKSSAATVTILGMTFKENVPDTRNSKVADIVEELRSFGLPVQVHDPLADPREVKRDYGIELIAMDALQPADAVIFAVAHEPFVRGGWGLLTQLLKGGAGIVFDVKSQLDRAQRPSSVELWRL